MKSGIKQAIAERKTALGIELGSTRIKAVLLDENHTPIASGGFDWENRLEDGVWTYRLEDVWVGIQNSLKELTNEVKERYDVELTSVGCMGVSGMMHGYLAFNKEGKQLVPFRTWRNTITGQAAEQLTGVFKFNVPQRWSISHLYQAILKKEEHVKDIACLTTLSGYVHWRLTGQRVLGIGDASGMFPIDSATQNYNDGMMGSFAALIAEEKMGWQLADVLPRVLPAGEDAGALTEEGAKLLTHGGSLKAGIPMCPPEGDAGTGMVATNSVAVRTGNVSAGTSIFAMLVLEKELSRVYPQIDIVTTPAGNPVAMVHCNNCTTDLDAWVRLFGEVLEAGGAKTEKSVLYEMLYNKALQGEADGGGLLAYNYYAGEHLTGFEEGRPLLVRLPDSRFSLENVMRTLLFSAMGTLKIGMEILAKKEHVRVEKLLGHGGLFKTKGVGQRLMAAALNVPLAVMESAGEGGAWGIALLAAFRANKADGETLEKYLAQKVFSKIESTCIEPNERDKRGFAAFMNRYERGLAIERAAVENLY